MSASVELLVKPLRSVRLKAGAQGEVSAVFATFNVIDFEDDVTLPGAFEDVEVPISAWSHSSWGAALPVGVARIRSTPTEAILDGRFFMETAAGRDTFTTVRELGPLCQWSYGYDAEGAYRGEFGGRRVRFLPRQVVHEVSPLLQGAGVNTRTLSSKADDEAAREFMRFVALQHNIDVTAASDELARQYVRFVALSRSGGNG